MFGRKKKEDLCWPTQYECELYTHRHNLVEGKPCQKKDVSIVLNKEFPALQQQKNMLLRSINRALANAHSFDVEMPEDIRQKYINLRTKVSRTSLAEYAGNWYRFEFQLTECTTLTEIWSNYRHTVYEERHEKQQRHAAAKKRMKQMKPARVNPNKATRSSLTPAHLYKKDWWNY